ncbi:MAG: ABC transporter ATP-binding protein [Verrucomicrobiota bacterium]
MNTNEPSIAIETRGLARAFGAVQAVQGLDLSVKRGEMFGLVGPDGAGKSTAIRLLCGILHPTGGTGQVLGCDLTTKADAIKSRIGYLSQNFTLYGDLTVDENIEFFADLHGVPDYKKRRDELLSFTRLTPFRKRLAQALSGGMKKKLALACTLIHTPELIFLDEPSTGVDPVSRGEFWNILTDILQQGVTILMTTPYLDEAERCHRISLMHRGRTFMHGTPAEVKAAMPGKIYRIECPNPAGAYQSLRARWSPNHLVLYGESLHLWAPGGLSDAQSTAAWLETRQLGPVTFAETEPTLEDAFIALLGEQTTNEEAA